MKDQAVIDRALPISHDRAGKYLTFSLASEEFGIRVLQVREIMGLQDITFVPQAEPHIKGVINLRGKVVPVICLRTKFGMPQIEYTQRTCIIVVQVRGEDGLMLMGVLVDSVSEVVTLNGAEIEDTPEFGTGQDLGYILGMAKVRDSVKILIDIEQILTASEISGLERLRK
ncbi:MAG TPA: chemotaxis protein CheW [Bryobacteraceae bacterium]|jgi:purine-binding chemotaxis protein CheW|nr:chemotaxis protein CheW [Bryobacteraceae bacterium]